MIEETLHNSVMYYTPTWVLALGLFLVMLCCIYSGRKVGQWRRRDNNETEDPVSTTTVSAMFGLLAFVLAFTFGMSSSRFDARRTIIVKEANAIGTAILRADMYGEPYRSAFRIDFKNYLDARLRYHDAGRDLDIIAASRKDADQWANNLWKRATGLSRDPLYESATRQMIPALNDMFDLNTTRLIGELAKVPSSIVWMLFVLSWASAFYTGYISVAKGKFDWFLSIGFCILIAVVVYITLDLDRPRRGIIQLSTPHLAMEELRLHFENTVK